MKDNYEPKKCGGFYREVWIPFFFIYLHVAFLVHKHTSRSYIRIFLPFYKMLMSKKVMLLLRKFMACLSSKIRFQPIKESFPNCMSSLVHYFHINPWNSLDFEIIWPSKPSLHYLLRNITIPTMSFSFKWFFIDTF